MKSPRSRDCIYWDTTALVVVALSVAFGFFLSRFGLASGTLRKIASILMPIICGAVLAYLMLPIHDKTRACTTPELKTAMKSEPAIGKLAETTGTLVSLIVLLAIMAGSFSMIIPQVYISIIGLQEGIGGYINNLILWMTKLFESNPDVQQAVMPYHEQVVEEFQKQLAEKLVPDMSMIIRQLSTGLLNVVMVVKNILIGVIVIVYFLNIKDTLTAQSRRTIHSVFKLREADRIASEVRFAHNMFGGFIAGKLLNPLIIEIMCFLALKSLKVLYVFLISVTIGVTNVTPFFGSFIGAIPSTFLILLVSPMKRLCFLIFILILQQFGGNVPGPKILGDSMGLPSFQVLFSILLLGRLMGFVGMIIGALISAVIHRLISMYVSNSLVKKDLSPRTGDYPCLDHTDEEEKIYVDRGI